MDMRFIVILVASLSLFACETDVEDADTGGDTQPPRVEDIGVDSAITLLDGAVLDSAPIQPPEGDATPIRDAHPPPPDPGEVERFIDPSAPADAAAQFAEGAPLPGCAVAQWLYPTPETVFPRNIKGVTFQWEHTGRRLYRLRATHGDLVMEWITAQDEVTPSAEAMRRLGSQSAASESPVVLTLATLLADGQFCEEAVGPIQFDQGRLSGAVYYWSTRDSGIMRLAADDEAPEAFLNPTTAPQIFCPACHALSRDGRKIAFTWTTFPPFGELAISDVEDPTNVFYDRAGVVGYFPSFAPDHNQIVGGAGGELIIRQVDTGAEIERLPLTPDTVAGSPDWSWQGDRITATVGPSGIENIIPDESINVGSIGQWHLQDGVWSMPETLVPQEGVWNNERPAYSPDGRWIAFNRTGPDQNADDMTNRSSELMIIGSDGGPPVRMTRANGGVELGNNWAKWSPPTGGRRQWLAFSSLRDYGHQLINDGNDSPTPQIWITSIDPDTPPGGDPSSPAFWLPFQSIESGNHIPYWAVFEKE